MLQLAVGEQSAGVFQGRQHVGIDLKTCLPANSGTC